MITYFYNFIRQFIQMEEQQSSKHLRLEQSYYQIDESGLKVVKSIAKQAKCLKKDKQYFIKQLLSSLGYSQSLKIFNQQCKTALHDKNPEQSSNKKKVLNKKKEDLKQDQLRQIIQSSPNYEAMIQALQRLYADNQIIEHQNYQQRQARRNYEMKMKNLYSDKKQAIIPKYKNIEIQLKGKYVQFIDVNYNQDICLLDSESFLHVISSSSQIKPCKVEKAGGLVYLKWVNSSIIFLINSNGRVGVFECMQDELKMKTTINLQLPQIKKICAIVIKVPVKPQKEYVRILLRNQNSQFIACQITVTEDTVKYTGGTLFESQYSFRSFNLLRVARSKEEDQEHYYGLTQDCKNIVKFDTTVNKQGIIWTSNKRIDSWANTKCRYFLILLICKSKQRKQDRQERAQKLFQYEFLRMNGHGSIIQRIPLDFKSPLLPSYVACNPTPIQIHQVRVMDPQWLTCFDWEDSLIYISLKTGKILHIQDEQQKKLQLIDVGPTNCIVYKSKEKIVLLSTVQSEKKKVLLEKKRPARERQSLILRLTRNGIPQTLLQLLQQLRYNHIEIEE